MQSNGQKRRFNDDGNDWQPAPVWVEIAFFAVTLVLTIGGCCLAAEIVHRVFQK